jgi:hypothetical protein
VRHGYKVATRGLVGSYVSTEVLSTYIAIEDDAVRNEEY